MPHPQLAQRQQDEEFIGREPPVTLLKPRLFGQPRDLVFFNPANSLGSPLMLTSP